MGLRLDLSDYHHHTHAVVTQDYLPGNNIFYKSTAGGHIKNVHTLLIIIFIIIRTRPVCI